jgi:hypothetical protein
MRTVSCGSAPPRSIRGTNPSPGVTITVPDIAQIRSFVLALP